MKDRRERRRKRGWEGGREGEWTLLGNGKGYRKGRAARMGGLRRAYIPVIVVTNHRDKDERLFKDVDTVR